MRLCGLDLEVALVPRDDSDAAQAERLRTLTPMASLADVIRSKQAANRPKDQRTLPTLRDLLSGRPGDG